MTHVRFSDPKPYELTPHNFRIFLVFLLSLHVLLGYPQTVDRVDGVGINVGDIDQALRFYTDVLHFVPVSEIEVHGPTYEQLKGVFGIRYKKVRLRLGGEEIELTDYLTPGSRSIPANSHSNDRWFQHIAIVVSDIDVAYQHLRKFNVVHVSTGPQTLPESIPEAAGIRAFYFRDPDGHTLELIQYPPDKGDPKWQQHDDRLFLGIDHTAIAVSNTPKSRRFYESLLGIGYRGESSNEGTEQEHLNNVRGARLRISGYRANDGIGLEFLEYVYPTNGRPYPDGVRSDDLLHFETLLTTTDINGLYQKLADAGVPIVSDGIIRLSASRYGYERGFYVRDPDGHFVGIFSK